MKTVFAWTFGATLALFWWAAMLTLYLAFNDPAPSRYIFVWMGGMLVISIMAATLDSILEKIFQELKEIRKTVIDKS